MYRDTFSHHLDAKRIPLADGIVRYHGGLARVFLIIVKTTGADLMLFGIPNLDLRRAPQIDAAVPVRMNNFPVDQQLKILIIPQRGQAESLAVEFQDTVIDGPVLAHELVGLCLLFGQFFRA